MVLNLVFDKCPLAKVMLVKVNSNIDLESPMLHTNFHKNGNQSTGSGKKSNGLTIHWHVTRNICTKFVFLFKRLLHMNFDFDFQF